MKMIQLADGSQFPSFGLGTWKSDKGLVYKAIRRAIEVGYTHIDCAAIYGNEEEVGEALRDALKAGDISRENLWVTSKLWNDAHLRKDVRPALEKTLRDLNLDYIDLYLIHWPVAFRPGTTFAKERSDYLTLEEAPLEETWEEMCKLKDSELTKHIGVSNMAQKRMEMLSQVGEQPEVLQVEAHPYLQQSALLEYCQEKKIGFTAYSPLGSRDRVNKKDDEPPLLEHRVVVEMAEKHGATPAQVLVAWAIQRGTSVIPKSTNPGRIAENYEGTKLTLESVDMEKLAAFETGFRYVNGRFFTGESSPYQIEELFV